MDVVQEVPTAPRVVQANGLEIALDTFGFPADPPVIMIMGLGTQRIAWPDEVCRELAGAGLFVVRFDNRDVGQSTHLSRLGMPSLWAAFALRQAPYRLDDMADDVVGLLDSLGIGAAHVVGASMGGFIAQSMAIKYPSRIRTLTLLMTSTGSRRVGRADLRVIWSLLRARPAENRDDAVAQSLGIQRLIGSPGYPLAEDRIRDIAGLSYDRAYDRAGQRRQMAAVLAQSDRTAALRRIEVPTLVIHGLDDPLVNMSGGLALARLIPAAKFVGYSGMGHDIPRPLWREIAHSIVALAGGPPGGD